MLLLPFAAFGAQQPAGRADQALEELERRLALQRAATHSGDPVRVTVATQRVTAFALQQVANIRLLEGADAQAVELYQQSLELEDSSATRVDLAVALLRSGKDDEANAEIIKALSADPKSARAWQFKGNLQMLREDYPAAAQSLSRSLDLQPDVNAMYALGFSLLKMHEPKKAEAVFQQILSLYGNRAIWHVVFGGAYRDSGYPDEAIAEFKRAVVMDPKVNHVHFYLGLTYLEKNHWGATPEAVAQFHEAERLEPRDYAVNFYLGAIESTAKDFANSDRHLHLAAELQPSSPEVWLYLGLNCFQRRDNANAKIYLQKAIDATGADETRNNFQIRRAYFVLGRIAILEGQHDQGERLLQRAREFQERSLAESAKTVNAAMKEEGLGSAPAVLPPTPQGAASEMIATAQATAQASGPVDPSAQIDPSLLAHAHLSDLQRRQLEAREKQLRQVLGSSFNDLGTADAREQQYPAALAYFQEAERWDATMPGLMRNLGIAAFRLNDFAESARAFQIALAAGPPDPRSRMMLAMSLFSLERYAEADKSFAMVSTAAMQDPRAAYAWAYSLAHTGQDQQANAIIDQLMQRQLAPDVLSLVCHVYTDTENYEHAIGCFRKVAQADPTMKRAHYEVGSALIHLDRPAEAVPELQEELKNSPGDPEVEYYLAYALLQTSHKEEARALLLQVIGARPAHAEAQYQLGKMLLEEGKAADAIQHLEIAVHADPERDYIHYQLQAAYRRAGRTEDADRELKVYRDIKARHREAPQHAMQTQ